MTSESAADRCELRPIGGLQPGSWSLAAEHGELVAQEQDLEVLGGVTAGELGEELDGAAQRQVGKSWQHRGASAVGAAEAPPEQAKADANPSAHAPCLNICTLRVLSRRCVRSGGW
jgi:hypothetical protein